MHTKQLIEIVSEKTNFNLEDVEVVFNCIMDEVKNINQLQQNINVNEFGTFKIQRVKASTRIRRKTNTTYQVKNYKYVKFVPHKKYKAQIRNKPLKTNIEE